MTAIAGLVDNGRVWVGGDSAGVAGLARTVRADAKVFTRKPYIFGFCGSFRMGQLVRYAFDAPIPDPNERDLNGFMVVEFIDALRDCLHAGGHTKKEDNVETIEGDFLVGINGRLYCVESDFQVGIPAHPYAAIGCGDHLALGSLHTTNHINWQTLDPRWRLRQALDAASAFSAGVCPPYIIKSVGP